METCDTTGTETDGGYTEAQFNWNVASYLTRRPDAPRARSVVLTRHNNDGVGPCVNTRAQIIDDAHANVAIDIHADGGPPSAAASRSSSRSPTGSTTRSIGLGPVRAGAALDASRPAPGCRSRTYDGVDGLQPRDDLAGLNLTTVPKVLIECGNMRNATDARCW